MIPIVFTATIVFVVYIQTQFSNQSMSMVISSVIPSIFIFIYFYFWENK